MEQEKQPKKTSRYSSIWDIPAKELPNRAEEIWPTECDAHANAADRQRKRKRLRSTVASAA
jgi:hypothetical protein